MKLTNCFECGHAFEITEQTCPLCYATNVLLHPAKETNSTDETTSSKPHPPAQAARTITPKGNDNEKPLERRAITYSIDKAIESGALNCGQKYLPAIYSESKIEDGRVVVMCKGTTIGAIRLLAPN